MTRWIIVLLCAALLAVTAILLAGILNMALPGAVTDFMGRAGDWWVLPVFLILVALIALAAYWPMAGRNRYRGPRPPRS